MVDQNNKIDLVIPCAGMGKRLGRLTKNITKNSLALTRSSQITKKNYKRKKK